jgi:hypothetical protein
VRTGKRASEERIAAKQTQDHQKLQQQQEKEHQQAAAKNYNDAQKQQMEQRHAQQTQQVEQKHATQQCRWNNTRRSGSLLQSRRAIRRRESRIDRALAVSGEVM